MYVTVTDLIWGLSARPLQGHDGGTEGVTPGSDGPKQLPLLWAQS